MRTTLLDLASPVFLSLGTFRRKARRGATMTGDEVRDEMLAVFREQQQRAETDPGLTLAWQQAQSPLIYLVDEVLTNTEWEYRGWWADNCLETKILGHPQKMRGIKFYDELELTKRQMPDVGQSTISQHIHMTDLMTVFYCCLRFGFEGKFAGQQQELQRETQQIFSVLPASRREQSRHFFADAYKHTVEVPPNYETMMRLATIVALVVGMVILLIGFREVLWSDLINGLEQSVDQVGNFFAAEAQPADGRGIEMNKLIQVYKQLPVELRFLLGWIAVCALVLVVSTVLPAGFTWPVLAGITVGFGVFYLIRKSFDILEKKQGRRLDLEITGQSGGPSRLEIAEREKEFKGKWLEGIDKLTKAKISLYQLPWYIILGEPGGGKTMTLLNSGMDFPMGKDELSGFGGTRNYNWWFTNSAVILDTAGRLVFEQEGTSDRAEWETFLKLLRRRRRCPINGIIVALPADKLMSDSAEQRHASAAIIRDRLRQIQTVLDVRFPVFVLVTKADLVAGFTEFYNELDSLQRNQLFGWSRPGDFSLAYDPSEFGGHFDELYKRLSELRLQFLGRVAADVELGWIYTYPEAFYALKDRIQDYIEVMFTKNIFAEPLFFRGFYFTSALQEGKPIIDILGEHLSGEELDNLEGLFPQSRSFFIHDFYTDKVSKEQGMVFRSQKHIRRMRLLRNSTLYIGLPVMLLFSVLTFLGYRSYRQAVSGPRETALQAAQLVDKYKTLQQEQRVWFETIEAEPQADIGRAVQLSARLSEASEQVQRPPGLASIMFASVGSDAADNVREIQCELVGYCILRPEVARVEQALSAEWTSSADDDPDAFATSLSTYINWHLGGSVGSLSALRAVLQDAPYLFPDSKEQIDLFFSSEGAGRLSAGMTSNQDHRQAVIEAALDQAQAYWLRSADIATHPRYAWWATLVEQCGQIRQQYTTLLSLRQDFERARQREQFQTQSRRWLETLGLADQDPGTAASGFKTGKFLQPLREHLAGAPRSGAEEPIKTLDEFCDDSKRQAQSFWTTLADALPAEVDEGQQEYVDTLGRRIKDSLAELETQLKVAQNAYRGRVAELQVDLLEPVPRLQPNKYQLKPSAVSAEGEVKILTDLLSGVSTTVDPYIENWAQQLSDLIEDHDRRSGGDYELAAEWRPDDLRKLARAVRSACRRYETQVVIEEIMAMLDPMPEAGLAKYMDMHAESASILQFPDLTNRHGASFVIKTIQAKRSLQDALASAVRAEVLTDSTELDRLLDRGARQYLQDYVETWSAAYDEYRLQGLSDLGWPESWDEFRRFLRENSSMLWKDYDDHLDAVLSNVVRLFQAQSESRLASAGTQQALRELLEEVDWPRDSKLKVFFDSALNSAEPPSRTRVRRLWKNFERDVDDFSFDALDKLKGKPVTFPMFGSGEDVPPALASEFLTTQLQHVVQTAEWLLWTDVFKKLEAELQQDYGSDRPFIFEGGKFDVETLRVMDTLETLAVIKGFRDRQPGISASPADGADADQPQPLLTGGERWQQFLKKGRFRVQIGSLAVDPQPGPEDYYAQVALDVPGLSVGEGDPREQRLFPAAEASDLRVYRWVPEDGTMAISLWGVTGTSERLGAELQPRVLQLPARYGLIELIRQYGQAQEDGAWIVKLSKDMTQITGLENEASGELERWIAFRIKFIDPADGLPSPIGLPDLNSLAGPRPAPPWR